TGTGEPLVGRLLTYDALEMRFDEFRVARRPDCAVCGDNPTITEPRDPAPPPRAAAAPGVRRLSAAELEALLREGSGATTLVDVREAYACDDGRRDGAAHLPAGDVL